ncbi:MAG: CamS family sex pheromone protein, partial [Subdoligranulum sp.]|nr:CamS family sex pheromone protein [Subdoligranulum sp.]
MKRFLCATFFMALVVLFAACGALNSNAAASTATATPTSST